MADILYLVHRVPYPPDKGDKERSYNLLKYLAQRHRVHLGTFIDDPADEAHLPALRALCADVHVARLRPRSARLASLRGLLEGRPLTLPYYANKGLADWVRGKLAATGPGSIDTTLVFSSCMAQYTQGVPQERLLVDFVDVDSAKWAEYADQHRFPMSWLYRREGRTLLAWERRVARLARHSFFAADKEAELFHRLAPESAARVTGMSNGVDADFFAPAAGRASPFSPDETALVFTGAMDYWPNVDAVCWFVQQVLPALRQQHPRLRLHIVGRSPTAAVQALAGEAVLVTGTVPDVRPYLQHAQVVVAPLRLARGVQNKILEAMAMGRPVVAAHACVQALRAQAGSELLAARGADDYVAQVNALLASPSLAAAVGAAGRARVLESYVWAAHLKQLDAFLLPASATAATPRPAAREAAASTQQVTQ